MEIRVLKELPAGTLDQCIKLPHICGLQPHSFIISQFLWVRNLGTTYISLLLRVPQSSSLGVSQAAFLSGAQVFFQARVNVQFLVVVELKSPFFLAVSQGPLSAPRGSHRSLPRGPDRSSHNTAASFFKHSRRIFLNPRPPFMGLPN